MADRALASGRISTDAILLELLILGSAPSLVETEPGSPHTVNSEMMGTLLSWMDAPVSVSSRTDGTALVQLPVPPRHVSPSEVTTTEC